MATNGDVRTEHKKVRLRQEEIYRQELKRDREIDASVVEVFMLGSPPRVDAHATRRASRPDMRACVEALGIRWTDDLTRLVTGSVTDVQAVRDRVVARSMVPGTTSRRKACRRSRAGS